MLIRRRIPGTDDRRIYSIIYNELIPHTRRSFPDKPIRRENIRRRIRKGVTFVAADVRHLPLGFVKTVVDENTLFIDMLAVRKSSHHRGMGSALMAEAEAYGSKKGCVVSILYVDEHNEKAQQFYDRRGYSPVNYEPEIRCYLLMKPLK